MNSLFLYSTQGTSLYFIESNRSAGKGLILEWTDTGWLDKQLQKKQPDRSQNLKSINAKCQVADSIMTRSDRQH